MSRTKPFVSPRIRELSEKESTRVSGSLLLSDISGFTAISEALGRKGKQGVEELSDLLNDYFNRMLRIVHSHGGEVTKFCGDSLLVGFYHDVSENTVRACAREMMEETEMSEDIETCAGSFSVSMKVVAKNGQWNELILGDDRRREHFLCGETVRQVMSMEDRALSGEIVIEWEKRGEGEQCAISNEQLSMNKQKADQDIRYRLQTTNYELRTTNSKEGRGRERDREWERSFLPQGVAALVDTELFGEHRAVTTAFLNFHGYDEENPETESLQKLFKEVISITEKYGGVIHDIDSHTQGSNIMILFGAPASHENDAERAVTASMELSKLKIGSLRTKAGVCTGFVYAGVIGSDWRKEYAVMGDAVNTAERLMETAKDGEVIVSGATFPITQDKIEYKELKSTKAKGKKELLKRFIPLGVKEEKYFRFGFVGREEEMKAILDAVDSGGKAIVVKGGAGIGKSRLLHEIKKRLSSEGARSEDISEDAGETFFGPESTHVKVLEGHTDEIRGPLHVFTSMVARESGIDDDDPESVKKEKLKNHIREMERVKQTEGYQTCPPSFVGSRRVIRVSDGESRLQMSEKIRRVGERKRGRRGETAGAKIEIESGELYKRIPFLGTMLFGIKYPNSLYEKVSTSLRFENLCDAIRYYIEYHAYAKSESREARDEREKQKSIRPARPPSSGAGGLSEYQNEKPEFRVQKEDAGLTTHDARVTTTNYELRTTNSRVVVMLDNFQWLRKDALKILEYITRALLTLSEAKNEITFILSGRPDRKVLERLTGKTPVLPAEIDVLEFDLLPLSEESTISLSSEILKNKPLPEEVAEAVFRRTEGNPFYLEQFLLDLIEKGLIREVEEKWVKTVRFKEEEIPENIFSAIISRVDRLEEKARDVLKVGSVVGMEFSERMVQGILEEPNVARYLAQTDKEKLTYRMVVKEIEHIFRHAIIKDVVYDSMLRKQRKELHGLVGQGIENLHSREIERFYGVLAHHFTRAEEWNKALSYNLKAGKQAAENYHNDEAIQYYSKAAEIGEEQAVGADLRGCLYDAYKALAEIYQSISSYAIARGYCQNAIAVVGVTDKKKLVDALNGITTTYSREGSYKESLRTAEQAYSISREHRYEFGMARSLHGMGASYWYQGDYAEAMKHFEEALDKSAGIDDKEGVAMNLNNIAMLCRAQGRYEDTMKHHADTLRISIEIGDKEGIAMSLNNMGGVYRSQGMHDEAMRCFVEALDLAREMGHKKGTATVLGNMGAVHETRGQYDEAMRYCIEAIQIVTEITGERGTTVHLQNVAGIHLCRGQFDEAIKACTEACRIEEETGSKGRIASIVCGMASIYLSLGSFKEAIKSARDVLTVLKEIGAEGEMLEPLIILINGFLQVRNVREAKEYVARADELAAHRPKDENMVSLKLSVSGVYESKGEYQLSAKCAGEALAISKEMGQPYEQVESYLRLCEIWGARQKKSGGAGEGEKGGKVQGTRCKEYAKEALTIARKLKSLSLLWKSYYWLYKVAGDKKHLRNTKKYLKEQFKHVPAKYLKDFKQYVGKYTREELDITEKAS